MLNTSYFYISWRKSNLARVNLKSNKHSHCFPIEVPISEAATGGVLKDKVFLKFLQNSQENTCARVSFLTMLQVSAYKFIKKEILAQVFFCEFCEISKNTFFAKHLRATASPISHANNFTKYSRPNKLSIL